MARPGKGLFSGFSGKFANAVGGTWNGIPVIRSLPTFKKNRKVSAKQEVQQAKFALAAKFLRSFTSLLKETIQPVAGQSVISTAVKNMLTQAIGGVYPDLMIDYNVVKVAKGSLRQAANPVVVSDAPGKLRFSWSDHSSLGNANKADKAILVAYNQELDGVIYAMDGGSREAGVGELDVSHFSGKEVHTWIAFRTGDGLQISDSIYTGALMVG